MKFGVFEDGEKIGEVEVDISNLGDLTEIKQVLDEWFDCGDLEGDEIDISIIGDEVYISVDECQYLWNKG